MVHTEPEQRLLWLPCTFTLSIYRYHTRYACHVHVLYANICSNVYIVQQTIACVCIYKLVCPNTTNWPLNANATKASMLGIFTTYNTPGNMMSSLQPYHERTDSTRRVFQSFDLFHLSLWCLIIVGLRVIHVSVSLF